MYARFGLFSAYKPPAHIIKDDFTLLFQAMQKSTQELSKMLLRPVCPSAENRTEIPPLREKNSL